MKKTIWCLFYRDNWNYGATADFIAWWSEFPQFEHIRTASKLTGTMHEEEIKRLLDTHYTENKYTGEWSLRNIEEGSVS